MDPLDDLPRIELGTWPTPVRRLAAVSDELGVEVWAKLEEDCGAWGGNKVRKLEHIFEEALRSHIHTLVTWGAATSNWTAAAALHGPPAGFDVVLGLGGTIPDDYTRLYDDLGTRVFRFPHLVLAPLALTVARATAGRTVRYLPVGGSGTVGDLGSARAGAEVAAAISSGELPSPTHAFVATGSSGTAAGLAVGLGLGGALVTVVAVKVSDWPYATTHMVTGRINSLLLRLEELGIRNVVPARWFLDRDHLGRGYGKATPESRAAIDLAAKDGLVLDPTYGAKAFAALIGHARREGAGPYLFVHTSPTRPAPLPD
ncbi:MAG: 1-aminocyclopropane-1-carboxylate deaminase/D-cysteine desulfhydrase [Actinomycetota bacterium]